MPLSSDSPCASCPKLSKPFAGDPAGALALVGSLSTGAATREASLDLDLGAVEKELPEFNEMHIMVQNQLEAKEELYKVAEENDKKGLAYAPQNFTNEQSKEVGKIEDEMDQEGGRVTGAMFRAEQGAMKVAKKSNFTPKDPEGRGSGEGDSGRANRDERGGPGNQEYPRRSLRDDGIGGSARGAAVRAASSPCDLVLCVVHMIRRLRQVLERSSWREGRTLLIATPTALNQSSYVAG